MEELDEEIIGAIRKGWGDAAGISMMVRHVARKVSKSRGNSEPWRIIERRLQFLRKAGKITWSRTYGWEIV